MALIDADDLMNELDVLVDEAKDNKVWGRLEGLHYALDRLREASVIDAIPVEWLDDKFMDLENKDLLLSRSAWYVLRKWKEEREKVKS